jgi:hypothetical protein
VIYILHPTLPSYTFCTQQFCDTHFADNTSVICNSTPDHWNSQASLYPGSQLSSHSPCSVVYIFHPKLCDLQFHTLPTLLRQPSLYPGPQKFQPFIALFNSRHIPVLPNAHSFIGIYKQKTHSTTIYRSPTDPRVGAIINLAPKTYVIYKSVIYILHPKLSWSTIRPHIGTWFTFGPQIIY